MASSRPLPPSSKLSDLEITIVSAKHLKNVNWQHGDLKPYVIFWLDPDHRLATKPDDSGSTRPVWNERFTLPISQSLHDSLLTLEIFHSKPSETPKPLVGTLRFPLKDLLDSDDNSFFLRNLELRRPSGRPQGKIRLKLAVRDRPVPPPAPDYHIPPPPSYYYSTAPPQDYSRGYSPSPYTSSIPPPVPAAAPPPSAAPYPYGGGYSDPYRGYYSGGYYSQPPLPPRPFFDRSSSYSTTASPGPSAPVDYSSYDQRQKGGSKMGLGTGLAVGAVAGVLGGLALEEGLKYEEQKIADRVENDIAARDDYSDYRGDY